MTLIKRQQYGRCATCDNTGWTVTRKGRNKTIENCYRCEKFESNEAALATYQLLYPPRKSWTVGRSEKFRPRLAV